MTHPYRGAMPEPKPIAMLIDGHRIRADDVDEFIAKLRALGRGLDFTVVETDGHFTLTFASGKSVDVAPCPPGLPN